MTAGRLLLLLLLVAIGMPGCAGVATQPKPRYLWPPLASDAKIEYLGFYASEANLKGALFSNLSEIVLGVDPARPLFRSPFAVDAWQRRVVVTDASSREIFLLDLARRSLRKFLLSGPGGEEKSFGFPAGVAIVDEERLLVSDAIAAQVELFAMDGRSLAVWGKGELSRPTGVAVDRRNRRVAVVDTGAHRVALFDLNGASLGFLGARGSLPGEFNYPLDADFDAEGRLFVLDSMNFRVQRFDWAGQGYHYATSFGETGTASGSFSRPKALAVSPSGHVYVTDALANKIVIFDADGTYLLSFGGKFVATGGKFSPGGFYMPNGIAVDDREGIWVVDSLNRMIHHFQYLNEAYLRDHPILPGEIAPVITEP